MYASWALHQRSSINGVTMRVQSAVNDSNKPLNTPGATVKPDTDILLAIHHLCTHMASSCTILCQHVYGHQDSQRSTSSVFADNEVQPSSFQHWLSLNNSLASDFEVDTEHMVKMPPSIGPILPEAPKQQECPLSFICNIMWLPCLHHISGCPSGDYCHNLPPTLSPPYPGSRAMLCIGTTWITSCFQHHILHTWWSTPIQQYCHNKYGWHM